MVACVKAARPQIADDAQAIVRTLVSNRIPRACLNAAYTAFPLPLKGSFHRRFSRTFWNQPAREVKGVWRIRFAGRSVRVPLTSRNLQLDWDAATALLGHDAEVKATYTALLNSSSRPDVFLDVGANYGTHSLLLLVHRVRTISFEPNDTCHEYYRSLCEANQVQPEIEPVAVTDRAGWIDLQFPPDEPWLGSTDRATRHRLALQYPITTRRVRTARLDDYLTRLPPGQVLLKVDTEGGETQVMSGARELLRRRRPIILFESLRGSNRPELADLLQDVAYGITRLPWAPGRPTPMLTRNAFVESGETNFIALFQAKSWAIHS